MNHYTYEYWIDGVCEYVGEGRKNRFFIHVLKANDGIVQTQWINHLRSSIQKQRHIEIRIVFISPDPKAVEEKEIELIAKYGRRDLGTGTLYNLTAGGGCQRGWVPTDEYRQRMSQLIKGKKRTDETKRRLSEASLGRKHTEATREKMRASSVNKNLGYKHTPEARERMRQAAIAREAAKKASNG